MMAADDHDADSGWRCARGTRYPLGATWTLSGTNFSVFSREAIGMELLIYDPPDSAEPARIIRLDPQFNHTFSFWHVLVEQLPVGVGYNWRVLLPEGSEYGSRLEVMDPLARAVLDIGWDRAAAASSKARKLGLRAQLLDTDYDWSGDRAVRQDLDDAIIYELHVGHFTRHPNAGVNAPGTFAGLIEKVPYLQSLGITHVQLMPVAAFDEQDVPPGVAERGLRNAWGYSPYAFCSPHPRYCETGITQDPADQLRDLVKALHAAGIGVILDVVFNHTAEGNADGPVINYKGFGNDFFYHRDPPAAPGEPRGWRDYTGCGNTVNCNHPLVSLLLLRCLERWVEDFRVDGFRFDLASVFARGEDGEPMSNPPLPWHIEFSRMLAELPMIAEAWDAAGLYQLGAFPGLAWTEWNGRYRDVMRRFVRGEAGLAGEVASCLAGSSDIYQPSGRRPRNSINFITCHDGFTLHDLVSYNHKHNEANGEENRDGADHNFSWNCGHEGPTDDPAINQLRQRQARNYMALLMLSQGVPMLLAGDEVLRSQQGNNNPWCQDNETVWFDWELTEKNAWMLRFTRAMIAFRKRHPALRRSHFLTGRPDPGRSQPDVSWHGRRIGAPPWEEEQGHQLAFTLAGLADDEEDLHIMLNMAPVAADFELPDCAPCQWHTAIDTARESPDDICSPAAQPLCAEGHCRVEAHSVMVLEARAVSA